MKKEIQIDLFEETNQKTKKKNYYQTFKKFFPYGFVSIRLSYEGIIFTFIIFMLVCVVIFSLGVERGKHITSKGTVNELMQRNDTLELSSQKKYTIQIATYCDKKSAANLTKELVQNGYRPFVIYTRNVYQVCIGKYPSKEVAKEELYNLVKKYKNSYIRSMP